MKAWLLPVGAALTALTWHVSSVAPAAGLDNSWHVALSLAASQGLGFGHAVVFTYGPLGFLSEPLLGIGHVGWLALGYASVAQLALAIVVVAAAVRLYGILVGIVVAFLALGLTLLISDLPAVLAFFAAVWILERDEPPQALWLVPSAGLLAALALLVKLNGGVVSVVVLALAVWRLTRRGLVAELTFAASFALALVVLWLASGNSLAALPTWVRESGRIVVSYTQAQATNASGRTGETVLGAVLVAMFAVLVARYARTLPRARAVALVLASAVFVAVFAKEGFVRHDLLHTPGFFGLLAVGSLAFAWRGSGVVLVPVIVVGAGVATIAAPDVSFSSLYRPHYGSLDVSGARARAQEELAVPPSMLRLLRGHTVDSAPYETTAIWAYRLRWRPEPLLQWYIAYDAALDRFNAAAVATRGAERVLVESTAGTDSELLAFQAPATYLALLCHYRELASDEHWEVLGRTRARCSAERTLATVEVAPGETIRVPQAGAREIVVAHVVVRQSLGERLESVVLKPRSSPRIAIGGAAYRLVAATASGPLIMRTPVGAGRAPIFGGFTAYPSFSITSHATVRFGAVRIRPEPFHVDPQQPQPGSVAANAIEVQGRRYRLDVSAFIGRVVAARRDSRTAVVTGWTSAAGRHASPPTVAAFEGRRLVGVAIPSARSGFMLFVRLPRGAPLRVFAYGAGRATELRYPAGYPFG